MLYNFLVLGYIPGTNIQLSFQAVIGLSAVFMGAASITWIELRRRGLSWQPSLIRQPLHANRLHLRVR